MSADAFVQHLTQVLLILVFLAVAAKAVRQPRRVNVDTALLFGAIAVIIAESWVTQLSHVTSGRVLTTVVIILLMAIPYLLLRLVDDFAGVSRWLMGAALAGLLLSTLAAAIWSGPQLPLAITLLLVLYFAALSAYDAAAFVRAARHSSGITGRRMRAVALGTLCLGLVILLAGIHATLPHSPAWIWTAIGDLLTLGCGVSYFVGFATPSWLRRTWQEPELRAFLGRAASLPRLPDTASIVHELEHGAASSLGTEHAVIGLWNEMTGALEFDIDSRQPGPPTTHPIAVEAFNKQHWVFSGNAARDYPDGAARYRAYGANSVLAVPITAGERRLGVLAIYAARAPIFAEDDLQLAQLLADQAAVVLESRALIDEAARVQAREEATRLKDDFLSAAAHDLKTPLTTLIAQGQLMERRARRKPDAPADLRGIQRLVDSAQRLRQLMTDLLDVSRVEQGKLLGKREVIDLVPLIREVCLAHASPHHRSVVDADESIVGVYDAIRIRQLVDNLVGNAVKYSPEGGEICVRLWREGDAANLTVTDQGIGIPPGDLPDLFDRFHRGTNVDDRRFAGMGLGLYICRGIAQQHGGRLWATSPGPGKGSNFHVVLPLQAAALSEVPVAVEESA